MTVLTQLVVMRVEVIRCRAIRDSAHVIYNLVCLCLVTHIIYLHRFLFLLAIELLCDTITMITLISVSLFATYRCSALLA